jgi:hypothetical protein
MSGAREVNQKRTDTLNYYIRPQTFPVAVKMCESLEGLPESVKRPRKDFGYRISGCQGISMARKYGWNVAMSKDDLFCAGMIIMGFVKPGEYFSGRLWMDGGYAETLEGAKRTSETILRFEYGKYQAVLFAPLARTGSPIQRRRHINVRLERRIRLCSIGGSARLIRGVPGGPLRNREQDLCCHRKRRDVLFYTLTQNG